MKISVITVAYNAEKTIAETLESVRMQEGVEIEHIVIDGSSTDNTMSIVSANEKHLATWISEPDDGIYDAMNKGINLATGDVIGFLNADDVYAHSRVLKIIAATIASNDVDSVFGDLVYVNPDMKKVTRRYSGKNFRPSRISYGWMPPHPTLYITKEKMKKIGMFKTHYKIAGDFEFIVRAYCTHNISYYYLNEILVRMRLGGVSTENWRSNVLHNKEIVDACKVNGVSTNFFKIYSKYPFKLLELFSKGTNNETT